jgi:Sec-independent protein translocase protein TatA
MNVRGLGLAIIGLRSACHKVYKKQIEKGKKRTKKNKKKKTKKKRERHKERKKETTKISLIPTSSWFLMSVRGWQ